MVETLKNFESVPEDSVQSYKASFHNAEVFSCGVEAHNNGYAADRAHNNALNTLISANSQNRASSQRD